MAGSAGVTESMVPIRDVALLVRRVGRGHPVVVLHGGPGAHHEYLLPQFDAFAQDRELIYYDQRGGGRSPVARDVPVGWTEQVADLEALRAHFGIERLTLAGYSWGGLLAILYSLQHRDRVERLALISPAPAWRAARESFERRFGAAQSRPCLPGGARDVSEKADCASEIPQRFSSGSSSCRWRRTSSIPAQARNLTPFRVTGRTQQEVWASLGDYDLRPRLGELQGIPALVMHGEDDPIPIEAARTAAQLIGAEFHPLPRCGHVPYVEARETFTSLLDGFLGR